MTEEKSQAAKEETITREFKGIGKFTVRPLKTGERLKIQSDAMTVNQRTGEMDIDAKAASLKELQACLVESPEGPKPPLPYLENLLCGMVEVLSKDVKKLSNPESDVIKN